jgi:hypothetical protein
MDLAKVLYDIVDDRESNQEKIRVVIFGLQGVVTVKG